MRSERKKTHDQVRNVESDEKLRVEIESRDLLGEVLEERLNSGPEVCDGRTQGREGRGELRSRRSKIEEEELEGNPHLEWKGTSIPGRGMVADRF